MNKKALIYSIVVSVLIHALLLTMFTVIKMPGIYSVLDRTKRFFNVKTLQEILPKQRKPRRVVRYIDQLKFQSPRFSNISPSYVETEMPQDKKVPFKKEKDSKPVDSLPEKSLQELIKQQSVEMRKLKQRQTEKDLVAVDASLERERSLEDILRGQGVSEEFFKQMPGFTPQTVSGGLEELKSRQPRSYISSGQPIIKRRKQYADLKGFLNYELYTYTDPLDGQKYFKISMQAGKNTMKLPHIPKKVIFLVDCSSSIRDDRINGFKKGLDYWLKNLDPKDYFNIAMFKKRIVWFKPRAVHPTVANVQAASEFAQKLTAGQRTDTYAALTEIIKHKNTHQPTYIVFFTDGKPTYGVRNLRKIVNDISNLNSGKYSIFSICGGAGIDRYFLDFISYKNRAWAEYSMRSFLIPKQMFKMYDKIKEPFLLKVRYQISGVQKETMFPKMLPDFFKNTAFSLFGKCRDQNEFLLRLLGDYKSKTNEFIIKGEFKDAIQGDVNIAREWAFNKVYYLISQLKDDKEDKQRIEEIKALCSKFNIVTPYSGGNIR